jgi:hypothetical protein
MEGHWRRVNQPLRRLTSRERNAVIAGMAITIVALVALVLASAGSTQPPPPPGCIRALVAGRTGGEVIHPCGQAAKATCAQASTFDTPRSRAVLESCREGRIEF